MGIRSYLVLAALAATAMMLNGCTSSRRGGGGGGGGGEDSGTVMLDGGGEEDSGGIVLRDSGTDSGPTGFDSGPDPECFTTSDCFSGEECVGGMCRPTGSRTCGDPVTAVSGTHCSDDATITCLEGCETGACQSDCLAADSNPNCLPCFNNNLIACANSNGCVDDWNFYTCCIEDECGVEASDACLEAAGSGVCMGDWDAYLTCLGDVDISTLCPNVLSSCFGM